MPNYPSANLPGGYPGGGMAVTPYPEQDGYWAPPKKYDNPLAAMLNGMGLGRAAQGANRMLGQPAPITPPSREVYDTLADVPMTDGAGNPRHARPMTRSEYLGQENPGVFHQSMYRGNTGFVY